MTPVERMAKAAFEREDSLAYGHAVNMADRIRSLKSEKQG